MNYCRRCIIPETKPGIVFDDEGICNACRAHDRKNRALHGIDWAARRAEFEELVDRVKARKAPVYDVVVPVSGGKDSITQVHHLLKRDLRILTVNIDYGIKTDIGRRNLARIPEMGATLFVVTPEANLHRRLIRLGLEDNGDPDLMSHNLLHAMPLRIAMRMQAPLVLMGENSAFEYGGAEEVAGSNSISHRWFIECVTNSGVDSQVIHDRYGIPLENLIAYEYPNEILESGTQAVFSSYYFHWDSESNYETAKQYGFEALDGPREGTYRTYVGIDEKINRVHHYLKVLKFGYGRATDHACEDIRNGRLTRQDAIELARKYDLEPLSDEYIDEVSAFLDMDTGAFVEALEKYRNPDIWVRGADGSWKIPGHLDD